MLVLTLNQNLFCNLIKFWSSDIFIMVMISKFLLNFINFCVIVRFLTKLLTLDILLLTAVRPLVVSRLVILGVSPLTSFILAVRVVLLAKLIMSGILSLIFLS